MCPRDTSVQEREAQRWKDKFLNALEEHEQRDRLASERIRVLRRALLGVSLAADGVDERLDDHLEALRRSLRKDEQASGLELLLEKIEKAVIRLDAGKQQDHAALKSALTLSLEQLEQMPVSRDLRRQAKRFNRDLSKSMREAGNRPHGVVTQFLTLLREVVAELGAAAASASSEGVSVAAESASPGLFRRFFGDSASARTAPAPSPAPADSRSSEAEDKAGTEPGSEPENEPGDENNIEHEGHKAPIRPRVASLRPRRAQDTGDGHDPRHDPRHNTNDNQPGPDSPAEPEAHTQADAEPAAQSANDARNDNVREDSEDLLHGELLRDGSGLAEPGFSYIADHVEPLLLRILENIHIAEQSRNLADSLREQVVRGLNWYEFVAVLENIVAIISQSMDQEREEFQGFLNQVTGNLARVEAFVSRSEDHLQRAREQDKNMDAAVRGHIDGISETVSSSSDLVELKQAVSGQIETILGALDHFRESREQHSGGMNQELRELTSRVSAMEQESRALREHLLRQQENALRDKLTGLANREAYDQAIRAAFENAGEHQRATDRDLCLAVCDVDHFKRINDSFGHLAGDKVLRVLARELESRLRDTDLVARYGGEEFVIMLPDTTRDDAMEVLEKLRAAAENMPFHVRDERVSVTVSFGVAHWRAGDTPDTLFQRADSALYRAKQQGRNCIEPDIDL